MQSRRAVEMDPAHAGQGVKELRLEMPAVVGGDGLRISKRAVRTDSRACAILRLTVP
jgi:hypothetical protein